MNGTSPQATSPPAGAASGEGTEKDFGRDSGLGITVPSSTGEPSEQDEALTAKMMEDLEAEYPQESPERMAHREAVLKELDALAAKWIVEMGVTEGKLSQEEAEASVTKLVTLGSYRLGVVHEGSDIDTLCIGPSFTTREAFFSTFVDELKKCEAVSDCFPIPDAFTPIVKLKMRGVSIDLLFARLARPLDAEQSQEDALKEDDVLRGMDEKSTRCLNGYRVSDMILQLVPNQEAFRQTLRFIKFWARRRGIYSNVLGFFGGITWALLVARVCQLFPNYAPSQLANRFFRVYDQWNWQKPVLLCDIVESLASQPGAKVWNPKVNPADKLHLMPVITPAFPAMNSTHNVTETTKRIISEEIKRGYDVTQPFCFFEHFRHFVRIEVLAMTEEVYMKFSGWVESKIRILMKLLSDVQGMIIHPNPEQYPLTSDERFPLGCGMFIGMQFYKDQGAFVGQGIDIRQAMVNFVEVINQWTEKDLYNGQYVIRLKKITANDIPAYARERELEKTKPRTGRPQQLERERSGTEGSA
eukprot:TRINITY_DN4698_c0_g1_i1.p1 TRINITY_DN4698_c0_g1~~TRINITY_DN4698_c0_g1_i1.p1  ORF type:complete len:528 (-),score=131.66 TRINITY_DN4698_c0_g1_i1:84-1667(-)